MRPGPSPSVPTPGRWRSGATPGGLGWRRTPRPHAGARELAVPRRSLGGTGAERRALAATHPHQPREAERGSRAGAGTRRGGLPLSAGGRPLRPLVPPPPAGPASRPPVHRAPRPGRLLGAGPEDGAPGAPTGLADRSIFRGGACPGSPLGGWPLTAATRGYLAVFLAWNCFQNPQGRLVLRTPRWNESPSPGSVLRCPQDDLSQNHLWRQETETETGTRVSRKGKEANRTKEVALPEHKNRN